jgi:hypothetical protein
MTFPSTIPKTTPKSVHDSASKGLPRRRFRTIGLFSPLACLTPKLQNLYHRAIYAALLDAGFKRTIWQYVFDEQITGLVKYGFNDIHIRFYPDRLFAEIEISRAFISHFYGPKYNASQFVLDALKGRLSEIEYQWLRRALLSETLRIEEAALPDCSNDLDAPEMPFEVIRSLEPHSILDRVKKHAARFNWRFIAIGAISVLAILLQHHLPESILAFSIVTSLGAVFAVAPRIPR